MSGNRPPYPKGDPRASAAGRKGGAVTAVQRRVAKLPSAVPYSGTVIELMDAAGMVGADWLPWRAFWKAVYALPM